MRPAETVASGSSYLHLHPLLSSSCFFCPADLKREMEMEQEKVCRRKGCEPKQEMGTSLEKGSCI